MAQNRSVAYVASIALACIVERMTVRFSSFAWAALLMVVASFRALCRRNPFRYRLAPLALLRMHVPCLASRRIREGNLRLKNCSMPTTLRRRWFTACRHPPCCERKGAQNSPRVCAIHVRFPPRLPFKRPQPCASRDWSRSHRAGRLTWPVMAVSFDCWCPMKMRCASSLARSMPPPTREIREKTSAHDGFSKRSFCFRQNSPIERQRTLPAKTGDKDPLKLN